MTRERFLAASVLAVAILVGLPASPAGAHPLGNFSLNQHTGIVVRPHGVDLELVVDMAEIPTFQIRPEIDTDHDRAISEAESAAYRQHACPNLADHLSTRLGGRAVPLSLTGSELQLLPGQADLPTLRLTCRLHGIGSTVGADVVVINDNYADRVGWREMMAVGSGVRLAGSDVPSDSISAALTRYPDDLLSSPLDQRAAHLTIAVGDEAGSATPPPLTPVARRAPLARGADGFTTAFTGLVARERFTVWFALLALVASIALGAVHALAPGHGKTIMAAYLVGERGSFRQAALLGLTVTATHTAGVLVLGLFLSGSTAVVPERLYPWLGLASGALLAVVGVGLLHRAWRRRAGGLVAFTGHHHDRQHDHHHHHYHGHEHYDGRADHDRGHVHADRDPLPISRRALIAMGTAGGLVPSPSALVVLLGAIALGRTWFGIALVLGYGVGMSATLVAAGLLIIRARSRIDARIQSGSRLGRLVLALPVITATFVIVAGTGLAARAADQL
jgi:ABC-type nickel/cobalt efflux system permease component RcnA